MDTELLVEESLFERVLEASFERPYAALETLLDDVALPHELAVGFFENEFGHFPNWMRPENSFVVALSYREPAPAAFSLAILLAIKSYLESLGEGDVRCQIDRVAVGSEFARFMVHGVGSNVVATWIASALAALAGAAVTGLGMHLGENERGAEVACRTAVIEAGLTSIKCLTPDDSVITIYADEIVMALPVGVRSEGEDFTRFGVLSPAGSADDSGRRAFMFRDATGGTLARVETSVTVRPNNIYAVRFPKRDFPPEQSPGPLIPAFVSTRDPRRFFPQAWIAELEMADGEN